VFARPHAHKNARHERLWLEANKALDTCDFERGPFLNLYIIAHNKSTVDKWDNFPGEIPNSGTGPVLLHRGESENKNRLSPVPSSHPQA
jgi:hypothetical protein